MSTICRTCLQKSRRTFKANQTVTDFGGGEVKISMVLRFCMPELYLGLSSNPEICYTCKEHLKVSYLFKKNCLKTEKIIQNFLKNARCTGKSVDLHDVLGYVDEQKQLQEELEKAKDRITLNAQEIISEWDETSVEAINSDRIIPDIEVRQSAPNPVNSKAKLHKKNKMKFCHETGLFVDQQGQFYDCSGFRVDINELGKDRVINLEETTVDTVQVTKDCTDFIQDTEASENFCKITSVFSLSADTTSKDPVGDKNDASEVNVTDEVNDANNIKKPNNENAASNLIDASTLNDANNINKSQVNIKQESLEVEINGGQFNFNYYPTDEETLDASETASYEDVQSTSRLQGIIDNLPEISDTNQYIDVPEFVHINNFGLKELEELRRQQQSDGMLESKKIQLNFKNKLPTLSAMESSNSGEKETKSEESKDESTAEVCLSAMPDTLLINGKRMVKCKEGYRLMEDPSSKPIQIRLGKAKKFVKRANSATQVEPDRKPATGRPVGRRKKIKIVPVNDKFKFCSQKGAKLDLKVGKASQNKNVKLLPGGDDKDVVVLFTNYTFDGEYINDHDYLVNPYKRNKILMDEGGQWICMCYICHTKHHVHSHIPHMQTHGSECKVCRVDFGTPYMLNVHVKSHSKPCGWCTERVPYGLKEKHEEEHFKDELEFENRKKKKVYHGVRGRPRKRSSKDDAVDTPDKQLPPPIKNTEPEPVKEEIKQPEEVNKFPFMDDTSSSESSDDEEWRKTASSSKKPRKRRRRRTKNDAEGLMVERSSRVLRSNVRKSYSETECEDIIANNLKLMSSTL